MQISKPLLKYVLRRSLPSVYRWIKTQHNIAAVRKGLRLVPEAALEQKYLEVLNLLIEIHGIERLGDYLEFGVYNGSSLACMHRALEQSELSMYACLASTRSRAYHQKLRQMMGVIGNQVSSAWITSWPSENDAVIDGKVGFYSTIKQ